jgi:hypothetical protein
MNIISSFCKNSYSRLGPYAKLMFWITVVSVVVGIIFGSLSWWQARHAATKEGQEMAQKDLTDIKKGVETLIYSKTKAELPQLEKRFPGGFEPIGIVRQQIIRSSVPFSINVTWDRATITEVTPDSLTMELQNVKVTRTETTPDGGTQSGGLNMMGVNVWRINRHSKLVSINNAINFWGYVLGGYVLSDENDVIVVAIGLQKME